MNKTPRTETVVKMAVGPMREYAIIEHAQTLERELLKAREERDEAREALRDMLSGWKYIRQVHGDLYGVGWDRAQIKAETALEGTK